MKEKKQTEKSEKKRKEPTVGKNLATAKKETATRGRIFNGVVIRKFPGRVTIEFERTIYIPKYERYLKKRTRIHARLPKSIEANEGDLISVQECRPLSKTIHFLVTEIIKKAEEEE
jgi:small subunit ribosomal protein S17